MNFCTVFAKKKKEFFLWIKSFPSLTFPKIVILKEPWALYFYRGKKKKDKSKWNKRFHFLKKSGENLFPQKRKNKSEGELKILRSYCVEKFNHKIAYETETLIFAVKTNFGPIRSRNTQVFGIPVWVVETANNKTRTPLQIRNTDLGLELLQNSLVSIFFLKGFGKCVLLQKPASSYNDLFMFVIF